jgi:hypothetical protein
MTAEHNKIVDRHTEIKLFSNTTLCANYVLRKNVYYTIRETKYNRIGLTEKRE